MRPINFGRLQKISEIYEEVANRPFNFFLEVLSDSVRRVLVILAESQREDFPDYIETDDQRLLFTIANSNHVTSVNELKQAIYLLVAREEQKAAADKMQNQ